MLILLNYIGVIRCYIIYFQTYRTFYMPKEKVEQKYFSHYKKSSIFHLIVPSYKNSPTTCPMVSKCVDGVTEMPLNPYGISVTPTTKK